MENNKLFKKVRCIPFSWGNNETNIEIPFGYQFDKIITVDNIWNGDSITSCYAIMLEESSLQEMAQSNKEYYDLEIDRIKKSQEAQYAEKIKGMELLKTFSDLISKFRCGDTVFYYSDNVKRYGSDEKLIESHIEAIQIDEFVLRRDKVKIKRVDENDYADTMEVQSRGKSGITAASLYKTKQEAIEGNRDYHEKYLKIKEDARNKSNAEAELRRIKEEAEILTKAEEIKSKTQV